MKKKSLILRNLTPQSIKALKTGSLTLGALLVSTGLHSLFGNTTIDEYEELSTDKISDQNSDEKIVLIETSIEMATSVSDNMAFGEAFSSARSELGAGGVFNWRANTYHTYTKEEWSEFTEEEMTDFGIQVAEQGHLDKIYETVKESLYASETPSTTDLVDNIEEEILDDRKVVEINQIETIRPSKVSQMTDPIETASSIEENMEEEIIERSQAIKETHDNNIPNEGLADLPIDIETNEDELVVVEPIVGVSDDNNDGILDTIVIDIDGDGYADTMLVDATQDGIVDMKASNIDGDSDLDVIIIDEDDDGIENDQESAFDEEVSMDGYLIIEDMDIDGFEDLADL